jgi:DNA polymerase I-like protein with 3'-5' exonuclease and polymerase domains
MDINDITAKNIAKAVAGTIERDDSILCCCPIHEARGAHSPSLLLSITSERRILFHCRSQNCDAKHFRAIRDHLVRCGLPLSHIGGSRYAEVHYDYQNADGSYAWTKVKRTTRKGKKSFLCGVWHESTKQWSNGRPDGAPLLFNLVAVANILAAAPATPLLIVEGEKDVLTAAGFGLLATTNADGAGKWRVEDTQTLIQLGVRRVVVCPDNDAAGIEHGISVAKTFQSAGVDTHWLELPGLGIKEDLSDWTPNQVQPEVLLVELVNTAPPFDDEALDWRGRLKVAGPNASCTYRGDAPNMLLALAHESRLKDCFAWNDFRQRVEVIRRTPWCLEEWWGPESLTPVGNRAIRDADIVKLGDYLTMSYDFGACAMQVSRAAIHAVADDHIFDELLEWIEALPAWDGTTRLDTWLGAYAGADAELHSSEYLALVGAKYIMQVLYRALNPGAKADYSLVFTAPQGFGKDRTLEAMFTPYYREGIPSPARNPADFARGIAGAIVAHAAEMSAWRKAEVEEQKAALTRCVDTDRPAYGYEVRSYPRRTCLAFSTNDFEFLQDATGNRRYWPISTIRERIDIEGLCRARNQILAEALHRLRGGELHWPTPEEEARVIAPERQEFGSEAALEIVAILERFIAEEPLTTRPNRVDFAWKWQRRPQPLSELYLDEFFGKCFGMYTAIKRQGLDRASKRDVSYCITWLRERGWRRVSKQLPDGRVRVWCAPGGAEDPHSSGPERGEGTPTHGAQKGERGGSNSRSQVGVVAAAGASEFDLVQVRAGAGGWGSTLPDDRLPVTLDDLEECFPRGCFLALDVETTGLSAESDDLRTVQFADGESAVVMVFRRPVEARALVVLADFLRGRRVVAHNARFEESWLRLAGIDIVLDDTALLFSAVRGSRLPKGDGHIGGNGGRISLAALAAMVLNETLDKSEQTSNWAAPELSAAQLAYALNDAVVTYRIWEALRAELHRKSQQHGIDIVAGYEDLRFSAAMARCMERAGVGFDVAAHEAWIARKEEPVLAIEAHLAAIDPALSPACIASGVRLDRLFRQRLDSYSAEARRSALLAWPKTEKIRRLSFGREDLAAVLVADRLQGAERQLVEALYARAEQVSGLATFGPAFSRHVINGRLHGQLHPGGAVTGRYTSSDPSLQNIPTDPEFRALFRAHEGRVLVDVDYSQLELRVFAALSGDAKMIAAFEDGWDYHELIMRRCGCTRRQAKAINFGILYGMSAATLAVDLGVDDIIAGEYLRAWDEQAPEGAAWRAALPRSYTTNSGVPTARRWIDYLDDADADTAAGTRPKNYPVQGGAADVMHRAMRILFERHRDWPGNVLPVLTVHDEIVVEVDSAAADRVGTLLADAMVEAFRDVLPNGPKRFLAIPGIGPTWAAAKAHGELREKAMRNGEPDPPPPPKIELHAASARSFVNYRTKPTEFDPAAIERLFAFVVERHRIYLRRQAGEPKPWTDDKILREWRFCCAYRELDAITAWLREHWREPHADDPDLWFALAVARRGINKVSSLAALGYPVPWPDHRARFLEIMAVEKNYGAAYTIPPAPGVRGRGTKHIGLAEKVFDQLWTKREKIRPRPGDKLESSYRNLYREPGLGGTGFLAAQIVADMKYVEPLRSATDWYTFAIPGPGSGRGLHRAFGRVGEDVHRKWREGDWRRWLGKLQVLLEPRWAEVGMEPPHAQDLQNIGLCEWDKYERVRLGEGHPKKHYNGGG